MDAKEILEHAKRLKTMAQIGLAYATNEYDTERYHELESISLKLMNMVSDEPFEKLQLYFDQNREYITPKVDVRAVIFNEKEEILLVKEKADGMWSLPGGWADIGTSPSEVAVKEALEETGLNVKPRKLLAILDKRCHPHPPSVNYVYKVFIQCEVIDGTWNEVFDILDKGFFKQDQLPPLSLERILPSQIDLMYEYLRNPYKEAFFD